MKDAGFSLLELVVVVAIISILLSVVTIDFNSWQKKSNVEMQTKEMLADFMNYRIQAIHTKRPIRLTLQTGNYAFKIYASEDEFINTPGGGTQVLNKNLTYSLTKEDGSSISGTTIDFDSRGIASSEQVVRIDSPNNAAAFDCLKIYTALTNMGKMENGTCKAK